MRALLVVMCLGGCAGSSASPAVRPIAPESAPVRADPEPAPLPRHWVGEWTDVKEQVSFSFDIRLAAPASGAVSGRILWTLMTVPPGHFLQGRVGDSGTEHVRGTWSPAENELRLTGTSVDSPGFLVVDEYKLTVAADRSSFDGRTRGSKGDWANPIHGRRSD